jgi:hypothetical protein
MTRIHPSGRSGRYTATPSEHTRPQGSSCTLSSPTRAHFTSERAQQTTEKYAAHSISLLMTTRVRSSRHLPAPIWVMAPMPLTRLRYRI